jgi:hypothetical protein
MKDKTVRKFKSKNKNAFIDGKQFSDVNADEINDKFQSNVKLVLPNVDDEDSIESMFKNEQNANQDNVKELFFEDKVKARTDISSRQIKLITKAFYLAKITGMNEINAILSDFLTLSISKDRKSRAEYVEGLKAKIDQSMMSGSQNMRGQFGK